MIFIKKLIKILAILIVSLVLLFLGLTIPTWPSKARLCRDVESYLPREECSRLKSTSEIVYRAFPKGEVSSNDVKGALGKYLHEEHPTTYGHIEVYYLSIRPIDYLFRSFASYRFGYDNHGILVALSYDD